MNCFTGIGEIMGIMSIPKTEGTVGSRLLAPRLFNTIVLSDNFDNFIEWSV
jgi:hypothetical protein